MTDITIIAEIGINHNGSVKIARQLIDAAADAGVGAVKFQYRNLENAYSNAREIGDQILEKEIRKNYLNPETIIDLAQYAKSAGMVPGISFFDIADLSDFSQTIEQFEFFKIPSAELTNGSLIDAMLQIGPHVYVSTGSHFEHEIESAFSRLDRRAKWTPLHCISNYPTTLRNARLGYLSHMKERWQRPVGYSSHDVNWEVCLLAMQMGATVIERHITLDKSAPGLDHTSSSTPDEFAKLSAFAEAMSTLAAGDGPRGPNQGELLNRQNLGRSFFARRDIGEGEVLDADDLVYRSPKTGLDKSEIGLFLGKKTLKEIPKGAVISRSAFEHPKRLDPDVLAYARQQGLSLPVRLHDLDLLQSEFPIGAYEFHLSFDEVREPIDVSELESTQKYSVHLPDYVSSTLLMDPFSPDEGQREASIDVLNRTADFAGRLQDRTGCEVPVVGSFSVVHASLSEFFQKHADLLSGYRSRGILMMPQWLPPIAWYFGGSVTLHAMNNVADADHIKRLGMPVCMDICHLLMGSKLFGFQPESVMRELNGNIRHVHVADAAGVDGEGLQIGEGDAGNVEVIQRALQLPCLKVIEVWQGHLDNGAGFRNALLKLWELGHGA